MSTTSRTFGLGLKTSIFGSSRQNNGGLTGESDHCNNIDQPTISSVSRPFESRLRDEKFKLGYSLQNNERLCLEVNKSLLNRLNDQNMSLGPRVFGSQHSALDICSNMEDGVKLDQELYVANYRRNEQINMSSMYRAFGPLARNTTLNAGVRIQGNLGLSEEITSNGGFRRPAASRVIKGRNSTMSSRLFSYQNVERCSKNLSNINGFNVSHISRRGLDTFSDSMFASDGRHNWMDNRSVAGSILSVTSAKAQFMNLLENLHHSILKIVPNLPDSVRVEFDKVKEGLENINEMSIAPVKEADTASVISQSSKFICPQIPDHISATILGGSSIPLKTGKNILKKLNVMNKTNWLLEEEEENEAIATAINKSLSSEEDSALVFKKPKPFSKKKKSSHLLKIRTPQVTKNVKSKIRNRPISLRQWYPIAVGKDLAFCGIDEDGAVVRTEAVKKRVSNRRIELSNGLNCDLIGSPDTIVSVFSKKVISLLKNGLTDRWRVLQKELLNCQTKEDGNEIQESEISNAKMKYKKKMSSPKQPEKKLLPLKKDEKKLPPPKKKREKLSLVKKNERMNSPSINETVQAVQTRSGRIVKPPSLFWTAFGNNKVDSTLMLQSPEKNAGNDKNLVKKSEDIVHRISGTKLKRSAESSSDNSKKAIIGISIKKSTESSKKSVKKSKEIASLKTSRIASPKKDLKCEKEKKFGDITTVHSSTEEGIRITNSQESRAKRKREMIGDADFTRTKRSRPEKKTEAEVESTVNDGESLTKTSKKNKRITISGKRSLRGSDKKPPQPKQMIITEKSEQIKEKQKRNDSEDDFELLLDDIKIPEIGNISSKPQLSRRQLKVVSMETPPLKYFNNNLRILRSATPVRSPEWSISERTESEVKLFQKRRAEAHKKRMNTEVGQSVMKEKGKTFVQNRDLKNVLDWVAEKNVRSPQWTSRVLQYVIPSRKQMEQEDEDDEDDLERKFV